MPSYPPKQALIQQHIRSAAVAAAAAAAAAAAHTPKLYQSAPPSTAQHAHAPPPTPPDLLANSEPRVVELRVDNMTCHKCIGRVERALKALPGVLSASADLTAARARVEGSADVGELLAALQQAGYPACHITGISTGITGIATGTTGTKDSPEANARAAMHSDATSIGVGSKAKGGVEHGIHPLVPPPPSVPPPPPADCLLAEESLQEFVLQVEGITCGACVHRIEKGLLKLPGVRNASVSIATNSALIRVDRFVRSYADVC